MIAAICGTGSTETSNASKGTAQQRCHTHVSNQTGTNCNKRPRTCRLPLLLYPSLHVRTNCHALIIRTPPVPPCPADPNANVSTESVLAETRRTLTRNISAQREKDSQLANHIAHSDLFQAQVHLGGIGSLTVQLSRHRPSVPPDEVFVCFDIPVCRALWGKKHIKEREKSGVLVSNSSD